MAIAQKKKQDNIQSRKSKSNDKGKGGKKGSSKARAGFEGKISGSKKGKK